MLRLSIALCLLAFAGCDEAPVRASVSVAEAMSGDTTGYARATTVRDFAWPTDHGPHPAFKTEWWYVTGNVRATDGSDRRFGVQFTVFRSALAPDTAAARASGWATTQLYMAHVAIGDLAGGQFYSQERLARGAAGLAGSTPTRTFLGATEIAATGAPDASGAVPLHVTGSAQGAAFDLRARPTKPLVLQGDRGLSQKGAEVGNASYYYAQTRMATTGTVTLPGRDGAPGETVPVEGLTWLDREWSTSLLGDGLTGWDWFALQLDDGRDLMLFQIRGGADRVGEGSLVAADGAKTRLGVADFTLEPLGTWRASDGTEYPTRWRVRVPGQNLDVTVTAALDASELGGAVRYWEGAVDVAGSASGTGFLEMTGYADMRARGSEALSRTGG